MIRDIHTLRWDTLLGLKDVLGASPDAVWERTDNGERKYDVWFGVIPKIEHLLELHEVWPREQWHQAFFLNIPGGGWVHKHTDTNDIYQSYHIPVYSNAQSRCRHHLTDIDVIEYNLDCGHVYSFDRTQAHSSYNNGATNRTHLIMEILK